MKKLNVLLSVMAMSFVMVGCGGGSSSSTPVDPMSQKDGIVIAYKVPMGICEDPSFQSYLLSELQGTGAYNLLFREESNSVTCATYGKTEGTSNTEGCAVDYYNQGNSTCVIGFNINTSQNKYSVKKIGDTSIVEGINVLINSY